MQIVSRGDIWRQFAWLVNAYFLRKKQQQKKKNNKQTNINNLSSAEDAHKVLKVNPPTLACLNSFPASGDFCRLLITFANSLDPDQARQNIGPVLNPNCFTLLGYSWKVL